MSVFNQIRQAKEKFRTLRNNRLEQQTQAHKMELDRLKADNAKQKANHDLEMQIAKERATGKSYTTNRFNALIGKVKSAGNTVKNMDGTKPQNPFASNQVSGVSRSAFELGGANNSSRYDIKPTHNHFNTGGVMGMQENNPQLERLKKQNRNLKHTKLAYEHVLRKSGFKFDRR